MLVFPRVWSRLNDTTFRHLITAPHPTHKLVVINSFSICSSIFLNPYTGNTFFPELKFVGLHWSNGCLTASSHHLLGRACLPGFQAAQGWQMRHRQLLWHIMYCICCGNYGCRGTVGYSWGDRPFGGLSCLWGWPALSYVTWKNCIFQVGVQG